MVPTIIQERLSGLRWRERLLRLLWGLTRWAALVLGVLALACAGDWLLDRWHDVPLWLHAVLLFLQLAGGFFLAWVLVLFPQNYRLGDRDLALWVEERVPAFDHRLITAVELNRQGAPTQGMSRALLEAVTGEAEDAARKDSFARLVDHRRVGWSLGVVAAVAVVVLTPTLLWGDTVRALLRRQLLLGEPVPRSVTLESRTKQVWPAGDEVTLTFQAEGQGLGENLAGTVQVKSEGLPAEVYPLRFVSGADGKATYEAKLPASSNDFTYRAWLGDGRTRRPGKVDYEPRPVVVGQQAWLQLPDHVGRVSKDQPYERLLPQAEIKSPRDLRVRVVAEVQKPVTRGVVEILGPTPQGVGEVVLDRVPLLVLDEGRTVECIFAVREGQTGYRILVEDRNGFANVPPPRRGITVIEDELPVVTLLPERFAEDGVSTASEDFEVEGMPVPLGKTIRIAYVARAFDGLSRAALRYRVNEGEWQTLPLAEVKGSEQAGPFDFRRGVFENTGFRDQIEFHRAPSPDPMTVPPEIEGGGRFDFQTKALPNLKVGDQIEFHVEVYDRHPGHTEKPGRSEARLKAVVTVRDFNTWLVQTLEQERRIRELADRQRGVIKD